MILPDLTERTVQECVKIGITADFGADLGGGHIKPEDCTDVTTKNEGLLLPSYLITLISTAYKVNIY